MEFSSKSYDGHGNRISQDKKSIELKGWRKGLAIGIVSVGVLAILAIGGVFMADAASAGEWVECDVENVSINQDEDSGKNTAVFTSSDCEVINYKIRDRDLDDKTGMWNQINLEQNFKDNRVEFLLGDLSKKSALEGGLMSLLPSNAKEVRFINELN